MRCDELGSTVLPTAVDVQITNTGLANTGRIVRATCSRKAREN